MENRPKIIAVDFDGCLVTNKYPEVGEPIEKNIAKLKEEQATGTKVILWTNRRGEQLDQAVAFCNEHGILLDAVNANLPEVIEEFGGDTRKIFANEYWDDRAVLMSEQDIGEFSDGYHTFNSLYNQRLYLFAALVNAFPFLSWKSKCHSDGEIPFGGGWFIVGINTPSGQYTYHYELEHWELFHCKEIEKAPVWDGHTDQNVDQLLSLSSHEEYAWAENEIRLACEKEMEGTEKPEDASYGIGCYQSALRAYISLCHDGHSGMSIQITKSILNRLIDGKVLTPIFDTPDIWEKVEFGGTPGEHFQCKRMSSLFKHVYPDGSTTYSDVNRVNCMDISDPGITYTNSLATRFIDRLYPITFPYLPETKKYTIVREEFLFDPKNGNYDTVAFLYVLTPAGEKVEINRYFKEVDGHMAPIGKKEYDERKARAKHE